MFSLIVCIDENGGIGRSSGLPFKNSEDMKNFKQLTTNNVVIMGRKTWQSLPSGYLSNRVNIVISKTLRANIPNIIVKSSINDSISLVNSEYSNKEWFIIGGSTLYNWFLDHRMINKIYLTTVHLDGKCDVYIKYNRDFFVKHWILYDCPYDINVAMNKILPCTYEIFQLSADELLD